MPGNISQFLSHIKEQGIAKTSHFDVTFLPIAAGFPDLNMSELLTLRCESAELPGRQIVTTDNKIYGPIYKVPYQTIYSEMTMTFVDTAKMDIRKFFEQWATLIFNAQKNTIGFVDNIVSDVRIRQYDQSGTPESLNPILTFQLIRAFPININQLSTSWADDAAHKLSVTFFYERYDIISSISEKTYSTIESLKPLASRYSGDVEYPEHEKINDVQINAEAYAEAEVNKNARRTEGTLSSIVTDLKNKVTNSTPIESIRQFLP